LNFEQWTDDLSRSMTNALIEFGSKYNEEMAVFAVDCHPWNGVIVLAFLTQSELKDDPLVAEASEMAAWKHYDFGGGLLSWQSASDLGSSMRSAYEQSGDNRPVVARQFCRACATAVASKPVQDALSSFRLCKDFRITVPHPDTDEEFFVPN
jgi:hypothetical protein